MTIAGSDSGGGAGVQADLRTFAALGVHGTVALSAVTAQNTYEVRAVCALEAEMVRTQVEAVGDDFELRATKTGMLARPHTVREVARLASESRLGSLVVDPVLVTSSGHPLMETGGVDAYRDELLGYALVTTPNLREAALLARVDVRDIDTEATMAELGAVIRGFGAQWVLIKGGHLVDHDGQPRSPDVLVGPTGVMVLDGERVNTHNDHGTGCSMAAAIAARLALGDTPEAAVRFAKLFVHRALLGAANWELGRGHGPIDHMGWGS